MGFAPLHGDVVVDGLPVWLDYAGTGGHRVVFRRAVADEKALAELSGGGMTSSRQDAGEALAS